MRRAALVLLVAAACRPAPRSPAVIGNRTVDESATTRIRGALTEQSVASFLATRFGRQLAAGTFILEWNGTEADCLAEMAAMGWTDVGQLEQAIPRDFERRAAITFDVKDPANIPGTLRRVMIIHDVGRYAREAWQNHWGSFARGDLEVYRAYGVDLEPMRNLVTGDAI